MDGVDGRGLTRLRDGIAHPLRYRLARTGVSDDNEVLNFCGRWHGGFYPKTRWL